MASVSLPAGWRWGTGNARGSVLPPAARGQSNALGGVTTVGLGGRPASSVSAGRVGMTGNDALAFDAKMQRENSGQALVNRAMQMLNTPTAGSRGVSYNTGGGGSGGGGGWSGFGRGSRGGYPRSGGEGRAPIQGYSQYYTTPEGDKIPKKPAFGGLAEFYNLRDRGRPAFYGGSAKGYGGSASEVAGLQQTFGAVPGFQGFGAMNPYTNRPIPMPQTAQSKHSGRNSK